MILFKKEFNFYYTMKIIVKKWFSEKIHFPQIIDVKQIRIETEKAILVELDNCFDDLENENILNCSYYSNYMSCYTYKVEYNGLWIPKSVILKKQN